MTDHSGLHRRGLITTAAAAGLGVALPRLARAQGFGGDLAPVQAAIARNHDAAIARLRSWIALPQSQQRVVTARRGRR